MYPHNVQKQLWYILIKPYAEFKSNFHALTIITWQQNSKIRQTDATNELGISTVYPNEQGFALRQSRTKWEVCA